MSYLEIAQITSDAATGDRVVRYKLKGSKRQTVTIDSTSSLMEPLCYPILFNYGENGWGIDMKTQHKVDFQSYLACRLLRPDPNLLLEQGPTNNRMLQPVNRFQIFSRLGKLMIYVFFLTIHILNYIYVVSLYINILLP
jgi:hypothetical protein